VGKLFAGIGEKPGGAVHADNRNSTSRLERVHRPACGAVRPLSTPCKQPLSGSRLAAAVVPRVKLTAGRLKSTAKSKRTKARSRVRHLLVPTDLTSRSKKALQVADTVTLAGEWRVTCVKSRC
jgi:hypothetical protein